MSDEIGFESFRGRLTLSGTLTLRSPMHIGSGFADERHKEDESGEESIEIGGVVLGFDGKPVIPSTSLKGALRARLEQAGESKAVVDALFGTIKDKASDTGRQGCLVPMSATCASLSPLREVVGWETSPDKGTFLAQRTAIDGASGVPAKSQLFARHVVAPDATFNFRMTLMRDPDDLNANIGEAFKKLVGTLCKEGLYLGSGKGDGHGHLTLDLKTVSGVQIKDHAVTIIDGTGWLQKLKAAGSLGATDTRYKLILKSDDPFFVLGSKTNATGGAEGENNKLRAIRLKNGVPELPATSLMGALRAQAEWFEALHAMREGVKQGYIEVPERRVLLAELFGAKSDELGSLKESLAQNVQERRSEAEKKDKKPFRPSQISGFAGMLKVISIKPAQARICNIPSVKIDRFTQSPMDKALFETEAFVGPKFEVELALDHRAQDEHRAFMQGFLGYLVADGANAGLKLGHATNRGYGWFKVAVKSEGAR